jgi:hypothetical protein
VPRRCRPRLGGGTVLSRPDGFDARSTTLGAFAGVTGKVTITVTFAGIAPRTAKGCNLGQNAKLAGQYQSITGSGSVSFK